MKNKLLALAAAALMVASVGCARHSRCAKGPCSGGQESCQSCDTPCPPCKACRGLGCHLCKHRAQDNVGQFAPGPPVGQVTYPYYTTRGPRDFLDRNPQPIGP
jgi:hypothetical protein